MPAIRDDRTHSSWSCRMAWDGGDHDPARPGSMPRSRVRACGTSPGRAACTTSGWLRSRTATIPRQRRSARRAGRSITHSAFPVGGRCLPGHLATGRAEGNLAGAMPFIRMLALNREYRDLEKSRVASPDWRLAVAHAQVDQAAHLMALAATFKELPAPLTAPHSP